MVKHSSRPGVVSKQPAEAFAAAERQLQTGDQEGETPRNLLPGKVPGACESGRVRPLTCRRTGLWPSR
jgi:hypothetical protein